MHRHDSSREDISLEEPFQVLMVFSNPVPTALLKYCSIIITKEFLGKTNFPLQATQYDKHFGGVTLLTENNNFLIGTIIGESYLIVVVFLRLGE